MFEQMIIDCAKEGSLGKLGNAKDRPLPSRSFWKIPLQRSMQYAR